MKITLNHSKLAKTLNYASRAVSQKPNIPILSNVLLQVDDNSLKLSATNLDMGIHMWIPGQVEAEGKVTVNAKYIADFVLATSNKSENVDIDLKDTTVTVKTNDSKASFAIIPAEEYPVLPKTTKDPIFTITTSHFIDSLDKTMFACSNDLAAGRIQQSGVLFEIDSENNEISFVGLDGFRLSRRTCQIKNVNDEIGKDEIIVPAKYLSELVKILGDYPNIDKLDVYLSESNSQIIFTFDDIEFSIRLLEGPYPDYKRIMPKENAFSFEVAKPDLENAIKIANTFAKGNLGNKTLFDFDIENAQLTLSSTVAEVGEGQTKVTVKNPSADSDLNTAYTLRYLQDVVNHVQGKAIIFESKGPLAASVFKDKEDPQFMHIIMPMRREN